MAERVFLKHSSRAIVWRLLAVAFLLLPIACETMSDVAPTPVVAAATTLRVINNLEGSIPVWAVTLMADRRSGDPARNVLGDESIAAGTMRDFAVPAGVRDVKIVFPSGIDCFRILETEDVELTEDRITVLTVEDAEAGRLFPEGCDDS